MTYKLTTPYEWQTWGASPRTSNYARLSQKPITGGTLTGSIAPFLTDVPRGQTLIVNGTTVTLAQFPNQDDLAAASYYFLGGHEYTISDSQATVLINAGYGSWLTNI